MASIEEDPIQHVDQQENIEGDQRRDPFEDRSWASLTPESYRRTLMLILKLLLVLFVLNRNLNHSQAMYEPVKVPVLLENGKQFDYFALNMIWPTTICGKVATGTLKETGLTKPGDCLKRLKMFQRFRQYKFTIHGLWPSQKDLAVGRGPTDCWIRSGLDIARKVYTLSNIRAYWPSFIKDEKDFWASEWKKHGRCAAKLPHVRDSVGYFQRAVNLAADLDRIQEKLRRLRPGLNSGKEVTIDFQFLRNFLKAEFGKDVVINYQRITTTKSGIPNVEFWVEALSFCYDVFFKKMDCPIKKENSFKGPVMLPTIPSLDQVEAKPPVRHSYP